MIEIELCDEGFIVDPFEIEACLGQIFIDGAYWQIDIDGQITKEVVIH